MMDSSLLNKANSDTELDSSIVKIIVLTFFGVILALFFGYFLNLFLLASRPEFLIFSFLAAIGFLTLYLLDIFFIKTAWINNLIVFLEILAFLGPFYEKFSKIIGLIGLVGFLLLLWGVYSGRNELKERLKIKFWEVGKKSLPKAITGLALITAIVSVSYFSLEENNFFISKPVFEKYVSLLFGFDLVQNFLPGFDLSLLVEDLIKNIAINQIEGNSGFKILPSKVKTELISQTAKGLENKISKFTGVPLNPKIRASEALYETIVRKISQLPENNKSLILKIITALIFLTIIGLSWFIRFIAMLPAYLVYETCLALGFSTIMLEGKNKEVILLK